MASLVSAHSSEKHSVPIVALVAGEMSGDTLGAGLIRSLKQRWPTAKFVGIGGPQMIAEGFESWWDMERLSVMGIVDVIKRLSELLNIRRDLCKRLLRLQPDVFIGIDSPDFNLDVELKLHRAGIKTAHYVSPSVWAWRQSRIKKISKAVDLMLTLLPFEADFYKDHAVPVQFVGHPIADAVPDEIHRESLKLAMGFQRDEQVLALLPGSRSGELEYMSPLFLRVVSQLLARRPRLRIAVPLASPARRAQFERQLQAYPSLLSVVYLFDGQARELLGAADAVLMTSGTATLEALLMKCPMVVAFRWNPKAHAILSRMVKAPYIALPNLLADKALVPEFLQENATEENLLTAIRELLDSEDKRHAMRVSFEEIHQSLRCNADEVAADAIVKLVH